VTSGLPSFAEARQVVLEHANKLAQRDGDIVELIAAAGRTLAENITADRDLPPFHRATRDGYAVRAADLTNVPARLEVVGEIRAGAPPSESSRALKPGEAVEIMTGAPLPPGADAVVMVEYTGRDGEFVVIERGAAAGENFVPRASEARAGDVLLNIGSQLGPEQIAVAATTGHTSVRVFQRPRVAVLSTGDEVVDVAARPGPNEIRNSNAYAVAAQIELAGGDAVILPVAPDEPEQLRKLIQEGLAADLLLLSGGVSMGKHDLVEAALTRLGAEFFFTGAEIQPGRPIVFGRAPRAVSSSETTYFFGLPGNPISTMVCFEIFARAMVEALAGRQPVRLKTAAAKLAADVKVKTGLTRFLPAVISGEFDQASVAPVKWQGSGDLVAAARGNCWLVVPPDRELLKAGEMVNVLFR
jgi:molybdopterin molybdotransferase